MFACSPFRAWHRNSATKRAIAVFSGWNGMDDMGQRMEASMSFCSPARWRTSTSIFNSVSGENSVFRNFAFLLFDTVTATDNLPQSRV